MYIAATTPLENNYLKKTDKYGILSRGLLRKGDRYTPPHSPFFIIYYLLFIFLFIIIFIINLFI